MDKDFKNAEGYADPTAYEAIKKDESEKKAYYVMQTIFSLVKLAGYHIDGDLILTDWDDRKHNSRTVMPKYRHKHDV